MRHDSNRLVSMWDILPALPWRDRVALLTFHLERLGKPLEIPVTHSFEGQSYIRETVYPAGTFLTSREHLLGHELKLIAGRVLLIAPDGRFEFEPPASIMTTPGFYAVALALETSTVRSVHPNPEDSRDVEALEARFFGPAAALLERGHQVALEVAKRAQERLQ